MSAPERFKVSYSLRFDTAALPALGGLCASVNLEVLNTTGLQYRDLLRRAGVDGDEHTSCVLRWGLVAWLAR